MSGRKFMQGFATRRLRRTLRGHTVLRKSHSLSRVPETKASLSATPCASGPWSKLLLGAAADRGELVVRQYLLARIGGLNLNKALLYACAKAGGSVSYPLPPAWRKLLGERGFKIAAVRCALMWHVFIALSWVRGISHIGASVARGVSEMIRPRRGALGRHVFFDALAAGNLPQPCADGRSHDIVTWYRQWSRTAPRIETFCHTVPGAAPQVHGDALVVSVPSALVPISSPQTLLQYCSWGIAAGLLALLNMLRGRWWYALLLAEASAAAIARFHRPDDLAREYLFHNSSWVYRPLWTYEAERHGSRITFYFYSTNVEPFKRVDGNAAPSYGLQSMTWPHYLVWNEHQADFLRHAAAPVSAAAISVVGPIWFHTSGQELQALPPNSVAVFDVQPVRDALYKTVGADFDYYRPHTAIQFLSDVYESLQDCACTLALKRKRNIGRLIHPKYRRFLDMLGRRDNFIAVDSDVAALRLIENCIAVISMPFTSTALLGAALGKPSVYYDPSGMCQKDDRAAHGIDILCGKDELRAWLLSVLGQGRGDALRVASSSLRSELR